MARLECYYCLQNAIYLTRAAKNDLAEDDLTAERIILEYASKVETVQSVLIFEE